MIITRKDITVERVENPDKTDIRPFWKLKIRIPQLHLESPMTFTAEHAEEMADEICKMNVCPHCNKDI